MRVRFAGAVIAAVLTSACGSTGPSHVLDGPWDLIVVGGDTTLLLLGQHGASFAGYEVAMAFASDDANEIPPVCGRVAGDVVRLYLPPDSSGSFSGTFTNATTVTGALTTYAGTQPAILQGLSDNSPAFSDGVGGPLPPLPTHC